MRYLMCRPERYDLHHLLNPWMTWHEEVDLSRARRQWEALRRAVEDAGGEVALLPPGTPSGAMTFTRDTAVVLPGRRALVLRNVGQRGELEPDHVAAWLRGAGFEVGELGGEHRIDGGNVLPTAHRTWLVGIPPGAGHAAPEALAARLAEVTGHRVLGVPLAGGEFGHLDMAVADLAGRGWLIHRPALSEPDLTVAPWPELLADRPVIEVERDEARRLACIVVVVGTAVIGDLTDRLAGRIADLGLDPVPLPLDEFRRAGGGAHCLTLELGDSDEPDGYVP